MTSSHNSAELWDFVGLFVFCFFLSYTTHGHLPRENYFLSKIFGGNHHLENELAGCVPSFPILK